MKLPHHLKCVLISMLGKHLMIFIVTGEFKSSDLQYCLERFAVD